MEQNKLDRVEIQFEKIDFRRALTDQPLSLFRCFVSSISLCSPLQHNVFHILN